MRSRPLRAAALAVLAGTALAVLAALVLIDEGDGPSGLRGGGPLELTVFLSAHDPSEVILQWDGGPAIVEGWQYRLQPRGGDDAEWRDLPLLADATTYRLRGLPEHVVFEASIRPRGGGPEAHNEFRTNLLAYAAGPDGIVRANGGAALEPGGTFRFVSTNYVFTVPREGQWFVGWLPMHEYDNLVLIIEQETGLELFLDARMGTEAIWWEGESYRTRAARTSVPAERAAYRMMDDILESMRYVPADPDPAIRAIIKGAPGEVVVEWRPSVACSTGSTASERSNSPARRSAGRAGAGCRRARAGSASSLISRPRSAGAWR